MNRDESASCPFCKVVRRELPATVVYEDDQVLGFKDLAPKAPTHLLFVPKAHLPGLSHARTGDEPLLGHLYVTIARFARENDLASYRTVTNDGAQAGQSVFHMHVHVLAGRAMSWPPG